MPWQSGSRQRTGSENRLQNPKALLQWSISPSKAPPSKSPTTFPSSTNSQRTKCSNSEAYGGCWGDFTLGPSDGKVLPGWWHSKVGVSPSQGHRAGLYWGRGGIKLSSMHCWGNVLAADFPFFSPGSGQGLVNAEHMLYCWIIPPVQSVFSDVDSA